MRNGYILLHREGLTTEEWKHPLRTLAWIDFCTLAAWADYTADDGVLIKKGEVIASYSFLATRWRQNKSNVHTWIKRWIIERRVELRTERCTERNAERFLVLRYEEICQPTERATERLIERATERPTELIKENTRIKTEEIKISESAVAAIFKKKKTERKPRVRKLENPSFVPRHETVTLFNTIQLMCEQTKLINNVDLEALDVITSMYVTKIKMNSEVKDSVAWLVSKKKPAISDRFIAHWFRRALEIKKEAEIRDMQWKYEKNKETGGERGFGGLQKPSVILTKIKQLEPVQ